MKKEERSKEELFLKKSVGIIKENIKSYSTELAFLKKETKELYDQYRSNNPELHNDLVMTLGRQELAERTLLKNKKALEKPYFGRIDYVEHEEEEWLSFYLGKNGIMYDGTEILVVDWRAPISSVYYDSDIGESSYSSPFGEEIPITLNLKRTFEIEHSKLIDFYDTDVIANDEFLTKYLSKNKEVVLGEIIATIQKEQNAIIRDTPWHSVIVQGVAGSGKTTVAMHRISYLLYNYKDKLKSDEFYIIGSNKMLLGYITSILPSLDVYNMNQMTLTEFFESLLGDDFNREQLKFSLSDAYGKQEVPGGLAWEEAKRFKGSLSFVNALSCYMDRYEVREIASKEVEFHGVKLYSKQDLKEFLINFKALPLEEKAEMMNKKLASKIKGFFDTEENGNALKNELKKYRHYFGKKNTKIKYLNLYLDFLESLFQQQAWYQEQGITLPDLDTVQALFDEILNKKLDLYDLGAIAYLKKRLKATDDFRYISHIIIDEAQDFGVSLFFIMKKLFPECTYTIMGDISQNIYYNTGMNDWEELRNVVFSPERDRFYVLAKSYRNTVEISDFATQVLKKCTFKTYEIEPIIRHGRKVEIRKANSESLILKEAVSFIKESFTKGYGTTAVICRTVLEADHVRKLLIGYFPKDMQETKEDMIFKNGIMVLPIHITKGLEFDAVFLWDPSEEKYPTGDACAKLLYVAVTRALHELMIVALNEPSSLLVHY